MLPAGLLPRNRERLFNRAQPAARRLHQYGHIARQMLIAAHFHMRFGQVVPVKGFRQARIKLVFTHQPIGRSRLLEIGKVRALKALLMHPHVADIEGQIITGGARADHHHTAFFTHEGRDRKGALARMFKHQIGVVSLAGDLPNRGAKLAGLFEPSGIFRRY